MDICVFSVAPEDIIMAGIDKDHVEKDEDYELICTVGTIKPQGKVHWVIDGDVKITDNKEPEQNPDGKTWKLEGMYTARFVESDGKVKVECQVTDMQDQELNKKLYKEVDVYCEYNFYNY